VGRQDTNICSIRQAKVSFQSFNSFAKKTAPPLFTKNFLILVNYFCRTMSFRLFLFASLLAYVYGQDVDYGGIFDTNFGSSSAAPITTTTAAPKPSAIPHRTNVQPNPAPTESPPQVINIGKCHVPNIIS
jgi:hypothetical protein